MDVLKNYDLGYWAIVIALFVYVAQTIFKAFVESSIKKKNEIRLKAILIAEFMAEWVSHPQDRKRLRQLTGEVFLWLPSDLAKELSDILAHKEGAIGTREIMSRVRKHIHGPSDDFAAHQFIDFKLTDYEKAEINKKQNEAAEYLFIEEAKKNKKN